ncbi:MAG: hypothetical protein L3J87_02930, partial [Thermoplasmata archaeon]|nr:hypothetical protein [Thermoplasmata archaeon]
EAATGSHSLTALPARQMVHPLLHPSAAGRSNWVNLTSIVAPPGRAKAGIANDPADGEVVLFGGLGGAGYYTRGIYGDTWTYRAGAWTNLTPAHSPSAREDLAMAYDVADGYEVLFGGWNGSAALNDTWTFLHGNWTQLALNVSPEGRYAASLAYDDHDGCLVLFGGTGPGGADQNYTWTFSHGAWKNVSSGVAPKGRFDMSMTYDAHDGYLLLFGGLFPGSARGDTWKFVNGTWSKLAPPTTPSPRGSAAMAYDRPDGRVVLFGGWDFNAGGYQDTWTFEGGNWTKVVPGTVPSGREDTSTTYDSSDGYVLMVEGQCCYTYYNETWAYGGLVVRSFSAVPSAVDLGQRMSFQLQTASSPANLTYNYSGLPPGCAPANLSTINCTANVTGRFLVTVNVSAPWGTHVVLNTTVSIVPPPKIMDFRTLPGEVDVGQPVGLQVTMVNGTLPYGYLFHGLPTGCSSADTSNLSCRPRAVGAFTVEVVVTDGARWVDVANASLLVRPDPSIASSVATPSTLDLGQSTTFRINGTGGIGGLTYAYEGLPPGCLSANASTLVCRPVAAGTYSVVVGIVDASGVRQNRTVALQVNPDPIISAFNVTPSTIDLGENATFTFAGVGGTGLWSVQYVGLPPGCAAENNLTAFDCTPLSLGTFSLRSVLTDGAGWTVTANATLAVVQDPTVLSLVASRAAIDLGESFLLTANAVGGVGDLRFTYSNLPLGCQGANQSSITCHPQAVGLFGRITVVVRDASLRSAEATTAVNVEPRLLVTSFAYRPASIALGDSAEFLTVTQGGVGPLRFAYSGLPPGCPTTTNASFSCVPAASGEFNVSVSVSDASGATQGSNVSLSVSPALPPAPSGSDSFGLAAAAVGGSAAVIAGVGALLVRRRRARGLPGEGAPRDDPPSPLFADEATGADGVDSDLYRGEPPTSDLGPE